MKVWMKVWVTADALTGGVRKAEVEDVGDGLVRDRRHGLPIYYRPGEWYPTPEAAVARVRTMRDLEVTRLRRQIERLETLVFEVGTAP